MDHDHIASEILSVVAIVSAYFIVFTTTLVFVPKNATALRLVGVIAMFALQYIFFELVQQVLPYPSQHANVGMLSWTGFISSTEAVFVSRIDINDLSRRKGKLSQPSIGELLWRALCIYFNLRRVGTRWEIPRLRWPRQHMSRWSFLLLKLGQLVLCYVILDAVFLAPHPEMHLIAREKETLFGLGKLSAEDLIFRVVSTISFWITTLIALKFNVIVACFLSVSLGLSTPESWPYTNGPFSSLYTIRGFWG